MIGWRVKGWIEAPFAVFIRRLLTTPNIMSTLKFFYINISCFSDSPLLTYTKAYWIKRKSFCFVVMQSKSPMDSQKSVSYYCFSKVSGIFLIVYNLNHFKSAPEVALAASCHHRPNLIPASDSWALVFHGY
jgi:hypothetical protein